MAIFYFINWILFKGGNYSRRKLFAEIRFLNQCLKLGKYEVISRMGLCFFVLSGFVVISNEVFIKSAVRKSYYFICIGQPSRLKAFLFLFETVSNTILYQYLLSREYQFFLLSLCWDKLFWVLIYAK